MKTLEEIKKRYAECSGYEEWLDMLRNTGDFGHDRIINDISRQYAIEVAKEALKNASENSKTTQTHSSDGVFDVYKTVVDKQSILNESNIPKL